MDLTQARQFGADWAREHNHHHEWSGLECDGESFAAAKSGKLPTLHLEDVSAIPFVSVVTGVERYQHRARVRAFDGDVFAAVTPMSPGYEPYCRDVLQLGSPRLVLADPVGSPTAVARACRAGKAWRDLCEWASRSERVLLHPYMAISDVWELGAALAAETSTPVKVLGPTPSALWTANDKSCLSAVAQGVVGEGWIMRTEVSNDVDALARSLASIAAHSTHVGLKRTRCASAMGNLVFDAPWIRETSPDEVARVIAAFLTRTEWDGVEDVLAVEWGDTDLSPSTQMWIPPMGAGDPVIEGIYEQLLEGVEKVFLGSRPSRLPASLHAELTRASMLVSAAFQAMGYVGRCSFDFIVLGDPAGEFDLRFTECNGRWGGTSTPMFLVDRVGWRDEQGQRKPYLAQDFVRPALVGVTFDELRAALADLLYDPSTQQGRFVLYNVGPLEGSGKFDVISLGNTDEEAFEGVAEVLPRRLQV